MCKVDATLHDQIRVAKTSVTGPQSPSSWRSAVSSYAMLSDVTVWLGKRLREVQTVKGISQEKFTEFAGLHRTYISSVERGQRNISLINIEGHARALDVKMADLMPCLISP